MKEKVRLIFETGKRQYVLIYRADLIAPYEAERLSKSLRKILGNSAAKRMRVVPHPYESDANADVIMDWHADLYPPDGKMLSRVSNRMNGRHG